MHFTSLNKEELRPLNPRLPAFYFGADYNPEQWSEAFGYPDEQVWLEDMRLMKLARVNVATVGVFSWAALQPDEQTFTFGWLDRILDLLHEHGIFACLATSTASLPPWVAASYPDILPVDAQGVRRGYGERQSYCPTSPDFRRLTRNLVTALAERYKDHPALLTWHVSNEYIAGPTDRGIPCYCERCRVHFYEWLRARYTTLDALNRSWLTAFWSHIYTAWEQIQIPGPYTDRGVQGQMLDFARFLDQVYRACYLNEREVLRTITPHVPVTTNFLFPLKPLDLFTWGPELDVMSWDSYPARTTHPAEIAFRHDLVRGAKGGQPFLLMEQTPSQVQWMPQNPLKRPGIMRLLSYQAIAHGADAIQYFQWRQSRGSAEMYHGAIVSHVGHEHTRVFRDVAALGDELQALSQGIGQGILGARVPARVALVFSWPNWWNVEFLPGPSDQLKYLDEVLLYYRALWQAHIPVDIVPPDADLSAYELVVAPLLNMVTAQQAKAIEAYVEAGGVFVTSYFSGIVDEQALAWLGGYPGPLRKTLGIWVEEYDPLNLDQANTVQVSEHSRLAAGSYRCERWCDLLHLEGAEALATFGEDFYAGHPALTEHHLGKGRAFYVATHPEPAFINELVTLLRDDLHLASPFAVSEQVEVMQRQGRERTFTFLLNHGSVTATVTLPTPLYDLLSSTPQEGTINLPAYDVRILIDRLSAS